MAVRESLAYSTNSNSIGLPDRVSAFEFKTDKTLDEGDEEETRQEEESG